MPKIVNLASFLENTLCPPPFSQTPCILRIEKTSSSGNFGDAFLCIFGLAFVFSNKICLRVKCKRCCYIQEKKLFVSLQIRPSPTKLRVSILLLSFFATTSEGRKKSCYSRSRSFFMKMYSLSILQYKRRYNSTLTKNAIGALQLSINNTFVFCKRSRHHQIFFLRGFLSHHQKIRWGGQNR